MTTYTGLLSIPAFIIGYIVSVLTQHILPPILTALAEIFTQSQEVITIIGLIPILIYICGMIIFPTFFLYIGATAPNDNNKYTTVMMSIFTFIFGVIITITMWYWVTTLTDTITGNLMLAIFWTGLFITWIGSIIVTPILNIIKANT